MDAAGKLRQAMRTRARSGGFRARIISTLTITACVAGNWSAAQCEEPVPAARIARLVKKLGARSFVERSAADAELTRLGSAAREQLEGALESDDAEVRLRANELLRRLTSAELWKASWVEMSGEAAPASELLKSISEQTGNRLLVGDQYGSFHDKKLEVSYGGGPFWEVMDDVCRRSENHVRPHYDTRHPGLVIVAGARGANPVAYAGPVRAQVTSARRVYIEELDYSNGASEETHTFQINMQMIWEDRFRLVAYRSQPSLLMARTDTGVELSATQPSSSGWNVAGAGTRQLSMNLRLHPPPTDAATLEELRLGWGLIAVGDMATLELDDFETGKAHRQDDLELTITHWEQQGTRHEVKLLCARDLVIPEPKEIVYHENHVELFDEGGNAFRLQGQTNRLTDGGAELKLTFTADSAERKAARLRFSYPRIRSEHELEIAFDGVPLPVGTPR